jgi:SAM-dependent methyltransferase
VGSHEILVDGGCGKERFLERYSNRFENCIGIDFNIDDTKNNGKNIHYIMGDLESIPLKTDSIDVFLNNFVIEHIEHPKKFFMEVYRIMKVNGILIIWTPNGNSISGLVIRLLPLSSTKNLKKVFFGVPSHPTYYLSNSPLKLDRILRNCGFKKVKMDMIDSVFYFSESRVVRLLHSIFIKLTDFEGLNHFKDLIFAVYTKS